MWWMERSVAKPVQDGVPTTVDRMHTCTCTTRCRRMVDEWILLAIPFYHAIVLAKHSHRLEV